MQGSSAHLPADTDRNANNLSIPASSTANQYASYHAAAVLISSCDTTIARANANWVAQNRENADEIILIEDNVVPSLSPTEINEGKLKKTRCSITCCSLNGSLRMDWQTKPSRLVSPAYQITTK